MSRECLLLQFRVGPRRQEESQVFCCRVTISSDSQTTDYPCLNRVRERTWAVLVEFRLSSSPIGSWQSKSTRAAASLRSFNHWVRVLLLCWQNGVGYVKWNSKGQRQLRCSFQLSTAGYFEMVPEVCRQTATFSIGQCIACSLNMTWLKTIAVSAEWASASLTSSSAQET